MTAWFRKATRECNRISVHRAGGAWTTAWIGGAFLGAYEVYGVVVIIQAGKTLLAVALVVGLTPLWPFVIRAARMCAIGSRRGSYVRNFRRTRFVPWSEIDRFTVGTLGILPKVGILEQHDGERIPIAGIQGANVVSLPKKRSAERVIERLNHELRERQSTAEEPGGAVTGA